MEERSMSASMKLYSSPPLRLPSRSDLGRDAQISEHKTHISIASCLSFVVDHC